jgi:hypothetical protein
MVQVLDLIQTLILSRGTIVLFAKEDGTFKELSK